MTKSLNVTSGGVAAPGPDHELSLLEIRQRPLAFVAGLIREYGDIVHYRAPGWAATLLNRPDYIKHVLLDNFDNYGKDGTPDLLLLKPMLGHGLLTSDGADWERQRQVLNPMFMRREVERFASGITDATTAMLNRWEQYSETQSWDLSKEMAQLTLRIVAQALFGYEVMEEADRFGVAVDVLNETSGHLDTFDTGAVSRFQEALDVVRSTVHRVIIERLADVTSGDDTLGQLIAFSHQSGPDSAEGTAPLIDQVLTLLLAGHETTAKALGWAFYLLSQHPEEDDRVRLEAQSVLHGRYPTTADLPNLPYAWAVIQEAMRLYPPIWLTSRVARSSDVIDGYAISAGELVVFSPYVLHRRADLWPEPDRFWPERFLNLQKEPLTPYSYIPFSGGPRQCIGRQLAILELRLVLPMIVSRYHLELVPGHPVEPEALVTLRPKYGLPMYIHRQTARRGGA